MAAIKSVSLDRIKYHEMNLMSSAVSLALHWWSKHFFQCTTLDAFWYDVIFTIYLQKYNKSLF